MCFLALLSMRISLFHTSINKHLSYQLLHLHLFQLFNSISYDIILKKNTKKQKKRKKKNYQLKKQRHIYREESIRLIDEPDWPSIGLMCVVNIAETQK